MKILDKLKSWRKPVVIESVDLTYMRPVPRGTTSATIHMSGHVQDPRLYAKYAAELLFHMAGVADYSRLYDFFCDIGCLERWLTSVMNKDEASSAWWYGYDGYTDFTLYDQRRIDDYYKITYNPERNAIMVERLKGLGDEGSQ